MKVRIYRIDKGNPLPSQANPGDAGYDCYASEEVFFFPGEIRVVPLGIIAQAPEGYHFKLCLRSSMAKKNGFMLANGTGIVDHLYSGPNDEMRALLKAPDENMGFEIKRIQTVERALTGTDVLCSKRGFFVHRGDRICQLILEKNNEIEWDEQEDRDFAGKDRGGFGSSGF